MGGVAGEQELAQDGSSPRQADGRGRAGGVQGQDRPVWRE